MTSAATAATLPPATAAFVDSFRLRPPSKESKPLSQKRKAAFDVAPKKQLPKPQFSTANVGKRPGDQAEDDAAPDKPDKPDKLDKSESFKPGKLQKWLQEGGGNRAGLEEAREYLLRGPPYRGLHARQTKEAIKDLGGFWVKNPLKVGEAYDEVCFGWFAAATEDVLIELLRMPWVAVPQPPWKRERQTNDQQPQWVPLDLPVKSMERVVLLIKEFEAVEAEAAARKARKAAMARDASDEARAERERYSDIKADATAHVEQIMQRYGIEWNTAVASAASRCPALGPHIGLSSVFRALRALQLGICTTEEVATGAYASELSGNQRSERSERANEPDEGDERDDGDEGDGRDGREARARGTPSGCFMFGKGPGMIPLPTDRQWAQLKEELQREDAKAIRRAPADASLETTSTQSRETWCMKCVSEVVEQFADCSCVGDAEARAWTWCGACRAACCAQQECACRAPHEWRRQQERTRAEDRRRAEQAERGALCDAAFGAAPSAALDASTAREELL